MATASKDCPKGYIRRKGYTRRFKNTVKRLGYTVRRKDTVYTVRPKKEETYIASACIRDRGLAGKGPRDGEGIGSLRKGELLKYGYSYRLADSARRSALRKAVEHYGALGVYRKLDAVAKLSVRTAPDASRIFGLDRDWISSTYMRKK